MKRAEWMLDRNIFQKITKLLGEPTIDLFASRLNKEISIYVSWHPDPFASFFDAFSLD
jgi:hypothetical protein